MRLHRSSLRGLTVVLLFAASVIVYATSPSPTPRYWIGFSGHTSDDPGGHGAGVPKFLMQIDGFGGIVVPPKQVLKRGVRNLGPFDFGVAISGHAQYIDMWIPEVTAEGNRRLFKAVINKRSLDVSATEITPIVASNSYFISVTQRRSNNFLAFQVSLPGGEFYLANFLSSTGIVLEKQRLLRRHEATCHAAMNEDCGMSISADGRVLLLESYHQPKSSVIAQQVDFQNHRTIQSLIASGRTVQPLDVSGAVNGGTRYVLYSKQIHPFEYYLFLQRVELNTLRKVDQPVRIARTVPAPQAAVIEPHGRFILYSDVVPELTFQPLDATGHPSGAPRPLTQKLSAGMDILEEKN